MSTCVCGLGTSRETSHLNEAGGFCCVHSGNTCGYHPEHEYVDELKIRVLNSQRLTKDQLYELAETLSAVCGVAVRKIKSMTHDTIVAHARLRGGEILVLTAWKHQDFKDNIIEVAQMNAEIGDRYGI